MIDSTIYDRKTKNGQVTKNWDSAKDFDEFYNYFSDTTNDHHKYWKDIPWGIGAWGTYEYTFTRSQAIKKEDRIAYIQHITDALTNPKKYPKIKASIWFDNFESTIIEKPEDLERDDTFRKNYPE